MDNEQYQKEYDEAAAKLDAAAEATTARDTDGKFAKAAPEKVEPPPDKPAEDTPPKVDDPLAEIRTELEKTQKALKDTQAWGTKNAQALAQLERNRQVQERDAQRPAILDANPELADAIKYVANDPAPVHAAQDSKQQWRFIVDKAHPGIFNTDINPELEQSILGRLQAMPDAERDDPLLAIRVISEEKLAFTSQQVGKRFAAEAAKLNQKSAMSVPGAGGGGSRTPPDTALAEVQRIQSMSDADFQKEVRKVKGY